MNNVSDKYVIGIDFGTDSVRAVVVNAKNGDNVSSGICEYPRWMKGLYCDPSRSVFRQHPLDYLEAFETAVKEAIKNAGPIIADRICALAVDTTGSTIAPIDQEGNPLSLTTEFAENPDAMFYLWKDHSAIKEAQAVDKAFSSNGEEDYTRFQGSYSSEWWWAKILYAKRNAPTVCEKAASWVEHSDWIPAILTGKTKVNKLSRNASGAGHKALWHSDFGGLPSRKVLSSIDPYLAYVADSYNAPSNAGTVIGTILPEWAEKLGVNTDVIVSVGSFDAHAGAVGAGICPKTLVMVVGTSTVDLLVEDRDILRGKHVQDICGQAENSIIPGYVGIESGQAAFGDVFSWFRRTIMWSVRDMLSMDNTISDEKKKQMAENYYEVVIGRLDRENNNKRPDTNLVALDWFNGRRYPKVNDSVKGVIAGLTLGTTTPELYGALAMSTVFGAKRITEAMVTRGLVIDNIITVGGVPQKSPYMMQMMADIINRPIMVSGAKQCCAVGAAIYAAVAAGIYPDILTAGKNMCVGIERVYSPQSTYKAEYDSLYRKYLNTCRHEELMQIESEQY